MNKVWIVENEWTYNGCPDDYRNCYEHNILGVFGTEEAAIAYILEQLTVMLKRKREAMEYDDLCDVCFTELPTKEDLMLTKEFKFYDYWDTEEKFKYSEVPVQD